MFLVDRVRVIQSREAVHLMAALTATTRHQSAEHLTHARRYGSKARRILLGHDGPRFVK